MKNGQWKLPAVVAVLGLFCAGTVFARGASTPKAGDGAGPLTRQSSVDDAAHTQNAFYQEDADEDEDANEDRKDSPFQEEPAVAPMPDDAYDSPSDLPPLPSVPRDILMEDTPDEGGWGGSARCHSCNTGCGRARSRCDCTPATSCRESCSPCTTLCGGCGSGSGSGMVFGGWLDQGVTVNGRRVADRFNGPVTFNDRDGEYQMNQLWLFAEKEVDTGGYGWDIGGRVDAVYGTDWRFTQSFGLEDNWNESERFYGAALPQMYMDVAVNNLTVRMGHYYTIIGYEVVTAPDNFFYSHTYAMQYGEPRTHTGLLASYALGDQVAISAGFDRGWDKWEDNNNHQSFLGGVRWNSIQEAKSVAFAISSGPYDDAGQHNRTMYSVVLSYRPTSWLHYVLQHNYGVDNDGGLQLENGAIQDAKWYGINQELFYDFNDYWALGFRFEWFRDDNGTRVGGLGAPHGWTLGPDLAAGQRGWVGSFYAMTLGLNWKPTDRIVVRPEGRWDWYDGPADGANSLPYDAGTRCSQFTFATDLIITF